MLGIVVAGTSLMTASQQREESRFAQRAPATLTGTVVVTGNVTVQGSKDHATIQFDPDVLDELSREMSEYRFAAAIRLLRSRE